MITYSASDIIKRATQLADLENSDFISYTEKLALLNEAYQSLYQKSINKDVNAFVRFINTKDTIIHLPKDFYQLKAINLVSDGFMQPVLRRPASQSLNTLSYDMINNTVQINGTTAGTTISLEYYPTPKTLTFPSETRSIDIPNLVDMKEKYYVTLSESSDPSVWDVVVGDINTREGITFESTRAPFNTHIQNDSVTLLEKDTDNELVMEVYKFGTGEITELTTLVCYRGATYEYDSTDHSLYFLGELTEKFMDLEIELPDEKGIAFLSEDGHHYLFWNPIINTLINESGTYIELKRSANKFLALGDNIRINTASEYSVEYSLVNSKLNWESLGDCVIIKQTDENPNNGYGKLCKSHLGTNLELKSYLEDTSLNFPSNQYFTHLAYLLALSFKVKQGSDISQLSSLVASSEATFYDTLARDDWNFTRINNVY